MPIDKKDLVIQYAMTFINTPYVYGGNAGGLGIDCSGIACEVLKAFGVMSHKQDMSAQMLYAFLKKRSFTQSIGALVFFGKDKKSISHVGIEIPSVACMVEAGGGDATTDTIEEAIARGACVRIRPISYRNDLIEIVPF
jgi:hypothetical protein